MVTHLHSNVQSGLYLVLGLISLSIIRYTNSILGSGPWIVISVDYGQFTPNTGHMSSHSLPRGLCLVPWHYPYLNSSKLATNQDVRPTRMPMSGPALNLQTCKPICNSSPLPSSPMHAPCGCHVIIPINPLEGLHHHVSGHAHGAWKVETVGPLTWPHAIAHTRYSWH